MTTEDRWTYELRDERFELPVDLPVTVLFAFGRFGRAIAGEDADQLAALADLEDATRALLGKDFDRFMGAGPSQRELLALFEKAATVGGTSLGELSASSSSPNGGADPSSRTSLASTVAT
jgi:hypothetical protein